MTGLHVKEEAVEFCGLDLPMDDSAEGEEPTLPRWTAPLLAGDGHDAEEVSQMGAEQHMTEAEWKVAFLNKRREEPRLRGDQGTLFSPIAILKDLDIY